MNKFNKIPFKKVAFLLLLFFPVGLYSDINEDMGIYFRNNVVEKKLPNGITVLLLKKGFAPTTAMNISFRVGSADESYRFAGVAHMLEHMLFKGTEKLGTTNYKEEKKILSRIEAVGETISRLKLENPSNSKIAFLEKELKKLQEKHVKFTVSSPYSTLYGVNGGIDFNASTSRDVTGYYIQLPSEKIELWAKIESEKLKNPVFREFYRERDNVYEERLMRYESKGSGMIYEAFFATAFSAHPYRHPTIGWNSNIKYMSLGDIRKFYRMHYIPSRMTIALVGNFDIDKTYEIIKKYFADIPVRPDPGEIKVVEPKQKGEKRVIVNFQSKPYLMIGWKKPSAPSNVDYAFDIISVALGEGKSSRLYNSLVIKKKMVSSIYTWNGAPGSRYDNLFMIIATPNDGFTPSQVEKEVYKEIERFRKEFNVDELQRVKNISEASYVFMMDSNDGIARNLAYNQSVMKDWRYMTDYTKRINFITVSDVFRAFDNYVIKEGRTVGILKDSRVKK